MKIRRQSKNKHLKILGEERIKNLFDLAEKEFKTHPERANRYVELSRKIAMRYNIRLTKYKKRFCSECHAYFVPGENATVRTRRTQKAVITTCQSCGHVSRHPYRREKSKKVHRREKSRKDHKRLKSKVHRRKKKIHKKKLKSKKG